MTAMEYRYNASAALGLLALAETDLVTELLELAVAPATVGDARAVLHQQQALRGTDACRPEFRGQVPPEVGQLGPDRTWHAAYGCDVTGSYAVLALEPTATAPAAHGDGDWKICHECVPYEGNESLCAAELGAGRHRFSRHLAEVAGRYGLPEICAALWAITQLTYSLYERDLVERRELQRAVDEVTATLAGQLTDAARAELCHRVAHVVDRLEVFRRLTCVAPDCPGCPPCAEDGGGVCLCGGCHCCAAPVDDDSENGHSDWVSSLAVDYERRYEVNYALRCHARSRRVVLEVDDPWHGAPLVMLAPLLADSSHAGPRGSRWYVLDGKIAAASLLIDADDGDWQAFAVIGEAPADLLELGTAVTLAGEGMPSDVALRAASSLERLHTE